MEHEDELSNREKWMLDVGKIEEAFSKVVEATADICEVQQERDALKRWADAGQELFILLKTS